ncbi:hypothetical protein, partial [Brevibacterium epidermidis]
TKRSTTEVGDAIAARLG